MFGSRFILALVFALVASTGQTAFAGKKKGADTPKQEVRAEGAFYPDEYVPPEAPPPEAQAYDPFLVAGVGGLFVAAMAGGVAFVVAGRRLEAGGKRLGAR